MDAPLQPAEGFLIWLTLNFRQIDFLDSETGVGQAKSQLAVVGQDPQPLIRPEAELFNNLIIDRDAALLNPAVRLAARGHSRQRQKLVESNRQLPGQSEVDVEAEMKAQPAEVPLQAFE